MPDGPNPGQSYEAFIEGKAGASPPEPDLQAVVEHLEAIRDLHCCANDECVNEGVDCTAWSHALDALAILAEGGVFRGSARNEPT